MGRSEDLTALVRDRGSALVGYACLLTGDLHRAEDLVQEALVRTYARPVTAEVAWTEAYVRRVVLNTFLDGYRRERAWGRIRHLFASAGEEPRGWGQADVADGTVDRVDVQAALQSLPPRERACVVLRFYDDLTVPALAARLGITDGTAKRYLSDGTRRLVALLGPLSDTLDAAEDEADTHYVDVVNGGRR